MTIESTKIAEVELAKLPELNGYAETFSVKQGEMLRIRLAIRPRTKASAEATSVDRLVTLNVVCAVTSSVCSVVELEPSVMLFEQAPATYCGSGADYRAFVTLDTGQLSPGLYEASFLTGKGVRSRGIYFVVRPTWPEQYSKIVIVLPTFTWQAYNRVGGGSLYVLSGEYRERVALKRPIQSLGGALTLHTAESAIPFLKLARELELNCTIIDSLDLHNGIDSAEPRVIMLLGHDEYWTLNMRSCVDRLLDRGLFLLILAGNTCWWRADFDGENVTVRKRPGELSNQWFRFPEFDPEETTFGASYRFGGYPLSAHYRNPKSAIAPLLEKYTPDEVAQADGVSVRLPNHPLFQGLNLSADSRFGAEFALVSGEIDGLRLTASGAIDYKMCPKAPRDVSILATTTVAVSAWNPKGGFETACFLEARIRKGTVLNLSTFGIALGLFRQIEPIKTLARNAIMYACRALVGSNSDSLATRKRSSTEVGE